MVPVKGYSNFEPTKLVGGCPSKSVEKGHVLVAENTTLDEHVGESLPGIWYLRGLAGDHPRAGCEFINEPA
jgi:hypothetical protein